MRIAIVGMGAIGGWLGAVASRGGAHVSALARGATLEALKRDGLTLHDDRGTSCYPIAAQQDSRDLGEQDVIVIALKAPALAIVAPTLKPMLGPTTRIVMAMNGVPWWFLDGGFGGEFAGKQLSSVDPDGLVRQHIDTARVIGAVVHTGCSTPRPGVVQHASGNRVILGAATAAAHVDDIAALLERGGLEAPVSDCIQRDIWFKLWGNMTVNPMTMLTGVTIDTLMDDELAVGFMSSIMVEAAQIGERLGVHIDDAPQDRHVVTRRLGAFRTSMLQDLDAHRPVELDALLAAVLELGRLTGVPTPYGDALYAMARLRARELGIY